MFEDFSQFESVKTVDDLTLKQKYRLLRIGVGGTKFLGKNGKRLYEELYRRQCEASLKPDFVEILDEKSCSQDSGDNE